MRVDRLAQVVRLIRAKRTGPTLEEIVEATKRGLVTEQDAVDALERDFDESERSRQKREVPVGLQIEDELLAESDPETDLLREEAANLLLRIINDLPPRQAQCVELYYLEGFKQEGIAMRLGVSQQMVAQHLAAARDNLATTLATSDLVFCPSPGSLYRGTSIHALMVDPLRRQKTGHHPFFPYEMWMRWNAGARWSRYGIYRPVIQNRLDEYLSTTFDSPPLVGWWTARKPK